MIRIISAVMVRTHVPAVPTSRFKMRQIPPPIRPPPIELQPLFQSSDTLAAKDVPLSSFSPANIVTRTEVNTIKSPSRTKRSAFFSPGLSKNTITPVAMIKRQLTAIDFPSIP